MRKHAIIILPIYHTLELICVNKVECRARGTGWPAWA